MSCLCVYVCMLSMYVDKHAGIAMRIYTHGPTYVLCARKQLLHVYVDRYIYIMCILHDKNVFMYFMSL